MAFVDLPTVNDFSREALSNCVRASVGPTGTVSIRIAADIYKLMGSPLFCRVLNGTEEHKGRIAVLPRSMKTPDTRPIRATGPASKSPTIQLGARRIGVTPAPRKTITLPHEISENGLLIDVRPLMKPVASVAAA